MSLVVNDNCCSNKNFLCDRCQVESNRRIWQGNDEPLRPAGGDLTANESWQDLFEANSGMNTKSKASQPRTITNRNTPQPVGGGLPQTDWEW